MGQEGKKRYPNDLEVTILMTLLLGRKVPSLAQTHCIVGRSILARGETGVLADIYTRVRVSRMAKSSILSIATTV